MKFSTRGDKWEMATHIFGLVGNKEFTCVQVEDSEHRVRDYIRGMRENKMVTRIGGTSYAKVSAVYQLTPEVIEKIRRCG